jgi:dTDP-4-dehydrorhamnose reductase
MRVLVTGANGQLGRSLAKVGGDFVFTDLPEGDITDAAAMERLAADVDAIVNCAAWTNVEGAEDNEGAALLVNGTGPGIVAGVAARRGIPLVHISTDYVFDGTAHEPITETAAPHPLSAYGRTKLAGEEAVKASGCAAAVIRTSWLYSEFGNNFVGTMLRLGGQGKSLKVIGDQTGCPTFATDLARAIMVLLERGIEGFEIYNYCGGGQTTWFGFAREIFSQAGMDVDLSPVSTADYGARAPRPAYSVLDCSKIAAAGAVVRPWQESLRELIMING